MRRFMPLGLGLLLAAGVLAPANAQEAPVSPSPGSGEYTLGQVAGDAFGFLPAAEDGEVSVIAYGPIVMGEYTGLGFVVANATDEPVGQVEIAATVRDADGDEAGVVDMLEVQPPVIESGGYGIALGTLPLEVAGLPDGTVEPEVEWGEPTDEVEIGSPTVTGLTTGDVEISGSLSNQTGSDLQVVTVDEICFDDAGAITQAVTGFADSGAFGILEDGAETTFTLDTLVLDQGLPCDHILVASNGLVVAP